MDKSTGQKMNELARHHRVKKVILRPNGQILSCEEDRTLRLWDEDGQLLAVIGNNKGIKVLPNGRILSWSADKILRLWDEDGQLLAVMEGCLSPIEGVTVLRNGRILSREEDGTLRLWDGNGQLLAVMEGCLNPIEDIEVLPNGRILSWSADKTLRLWDGNGQLLAVMEGCLNPIEGVTVLRNGRILSREEDGTLRLWDGDGQPLAVMEGCLSPIEGIKVLPNGQILSWSKDGTMELWDGDSGQWLNIYFWHTHPIDGIRVLPNGRILSWDREGGLALWEIDNLLHNIYDYTWIVTVLPNGQILLWTSSHLLLLDGNNGEQLAALWDKDAWSNSLVGGATMLPDGRILSWDDDDKVTLHLWDTMNGVLLATLQAVDAPWLFPDLQAARATAENDGQLVTDQHVGWGLQNTAGLSRFGTPIPQVTAWQAESQATARALLDDGTLIVTLASGHVFCLKLHHGARRITLTELNALYEQQAD